MHMRVGLRTGKYFLNFIRKKISTVLKSIVKRALVHTTLSTPYKTHRFAFLFIFHDLHYVLANFTVYFKICLRNLSRGCDLAT